MPVQRAGERTLALRLNRLRGAGQRDRRDAGLTPVDAAAVLATHLQEVVRKHADELLTRDATKHLIDELRQVSPT
ncbi:MAG: FHIPEP family type III secretion protein, partial [Pirellulaceae bacterium]